MGDFGARVVPGEQAQVKGQGHHGPDLELEATMSAPGRYGHKAGPIVVTLLPLPTLVPLFMLLHLADYLRVK